MTGRPGRVRVLVVPDCPHAAKTVERLRQALDEAGAGEVTVDVEVVQPGQTPPVGFGGSPTVLIDGVDPFAATGAAPTDVACRLYHGDDGDGGAPSLAALRRAVRG